MKGIIKKENVSSFVTPLRNYAAIMGTSGIKIDVSKKDATSGKREVGIRALNKAFMVVANCQFTNIFDDFEFETDDAFSIGIIRISEFVSLFSAFEDTDLELAYDDKSKKLTITQGDSQISYAVADTDLIEGFTGQFKGNKWLTNFVYDEKFAKFVKAMGILQQQDVVDITGDAKGQKVIVVVKGKNVDTNSYKIVLQAKVEEDFSYQYKKEVMQIILSAKHDTTKLTVGERVIMVECTDKNSSMVYYITKSIKV